MPTAFGFWREGAESALTYSKGLLTKVIGTYSSIQVVFGPIWTKLGIHMFYDFIVFWHRRFLIGEVVKVLPTKKGYWISPIIL